MKRYNSLKEKSKIAPHDIEASFYIIGHTWKPIATADRKDRSIVSKLSPTILKKGEKFISADKGYGGGTQITLKVSWKNKNNILLGTTITFEDDKELKESGWI